MQIVQSSRPVTLIGGGPVGPGDLAEALALAPVLVAADSGAGVALDAGHMPQAVIGDLDSLRTAQRAQIPQDRLHWIREQDSTDFDKALRNIAAPLVLGIGFLGGRVDHQLAGFSTLMRNADRPCILLGAHEVVFHAPPALALNLARGDRVSLFPLAPVTGRSLGVEWPIDGLTLAPGGRIGTSNRATGPVQLEFDGPGMLVILERVALRAAMHALFPQSFWNVDASASRPC